ncbi:MAG: 1,4-dihydroxy-2-naphthoate octaprenyltransferase [Myxococcota bacterium]|jgi:1,4-dihydroxy-2-naphthoate octaprenyltransferase
MSARTLPTPQPPLALWRVWLLTARPKTLLAGVAPILVGTALACSFGTFHLGAAVAALLGALLLQIGCNLVNDAADFVRGTDNNRVGPARAAAEGWLTPHALWIGAGLCFVAAGLTGVYLFTRVGWPVVAIGLGGVLAAIAYTAGPKPLGYLGLGDVLVFIFFGPVAVIGTFFVQADAVTAQVVWASIPVGLLTTAILVVNNLRDRHSDKLTGKRTLAVRYGARASRVQYGLLLALSYAAVAVAVALGSAPAAWLIVGATAPVAWLTWRGFMRSDGAALNPFLGATARLLLLFSIALAVGVLVDLT